MKSKYDKKVRSNHRLFKASHDEDSSGDKQKDKKQAKNKFVEKNVNKYSQKAAGNFKKWIDDEVANVVEELHDEQSKRNKAAEDYDYEDEGLEDVAPANVYVRDTVGISRLEIYFGRKGNRLFPAPSGSVADDELAGEELADSFTVV
jgi:hypothetical protein